MKKLPYILAGIAVAGLSVFGGYRWGISRAASAPVIDAGAGTSDTAVAGAPAPNAGDTTTYTSSLYGFSLTYPKALGQVSDTDEGGGAHTLVFEDSANKQGFQIYVQPYAQTTVSKERFLSDSPSGVMNDPKDVIVGGEKATMFYGQEDGIGDTREVWFIHKGYLYEVVTYKGLDTWLAQIMQTWKFSA